MKRIVIATTSAFHLRHLARELIARDVSVQFMSYLPAWKVASYGIPRCHQRSFFYNGLPGSFLALTRWFGSKRQHASVEAMLKRTDDMMESHVPPCDVFVGLSGMAVATARYAKKKYGATIFIDRGAQHVLSQAELVSADGKSRISTFYRERELASYATADYMLLPSSHVARSFVERGYSPDRIFVNYLGVDTDRFRPSNPLVRGGRKIIFVGAWSYQKGCDLLSEAIRALPQYEFCHIGTRTDVPFPTEANFRSLGPLPQAQVATELPKYDLLVLPSRQDGFGMVLLEALSCGLKVVATDRTAAPDLASYGFDTQTLRCVPAGSVVELTRAIEMSMVSPADPLKAGVGAGSLVPPYSWSAYAARLLEFVDRRAE